MYPFNSSDHIRTSPYCIPHITMHMIKTQDPTPVTQHPSSLQATNWGFFFPNISGKGNAIITYSHIITELVMQS